MTHGRRQRSGLADVVIEAFLLFLLGWIVAFVMFFFHEFELFKAIDRPVIDSLMRTHARENLVSKTLDSTAKHPPRFVFVDISEEACRLWAEEKKTSCTLSMITPRDRMAEIVDDISAAIGRGGGPKLVVFDIEFAPLPVREGEKPSFTDEKLSSKIIELANKAVVISLRPMIVDPNSPSFRNIGFYSILDHPVAKNNLCEPDRASQANGLWFASPLIESDPDGVVRSVHAWDEILIEKTNQRGFIPGVGFLGAALLDSQFQCEVIRCYFDASNSMENSTSSTRQTRPNCEGKEIRIGDRTYPLPPADSWKISRILFSLPYQAEGAANLTDYPSVPSQIETIAAHTLDKRLKENPALLKDAIVIVGGSYWSSGDYHPVPLNARMPGAIVQANAIRAYAMGKIVVERFSWGVKFVFITVAAIIGALSHLLSSRAVTDARPWSAFFIRLGITIAGVACSFFVVVMIGRVWAFQELVMSGTAIGALTPALAVALEGTCGIFGQVREQFHEPVARAYFWLRKPDR